MNGDFAPQLEEAFAEGRGGNLLNDDGALEQLHDLHVFGIKVEDTGFEALFSDLVRDFCAGGDTEEGVAFFCDKADELFGGAALFGLLGLWLTG